MNLTIKVQIRSVYGEEKVYPACPAALIFAQIAKTTTLTDDTLRCVEALGYTIEVEHPRYIRRAA